MSGDGAQGHAHTHAASPYELSAPPGTVERLHPRLRAYFARIPDGHVGRGEGVFSVVGTPRRWLWPLLALLAHDGVLFPTWERDVRFTVENRPARVGRGSPRSGLEARPAVVARRTFLMRSGPRVMVDAITAEPGGLVDHLGRRGRVSAALRVETQDNGTQDGGTQDDGVGRGALRLVSTSVTLRVLGLALRLPTVVAPRVTLVERFDDDLDRQCVSLTLDAPFVGTLYRYAGTFTYAVVPDDDAPSDAARRPA
jgi:hypothetical protein